MTLTNTNKIQITVIIPTIGRPSLVNTLESIAEQTYKNYEIIVTDDTKDQKAKEIVEKFKETHKEITIRYIQNKRYKQGPGGNKNNGLDHAQGKFITFVDDDDVLLPEALEIAINNIMEKGLDVFLANCKDNVQGKYTGLSYGISQYVSYYDFLKGRFDGEYFVLVKRNIIGEDRFPDDTWGGEGVLWFKVFKRAKKIYYLDVPLKIYNSLNVEDRVTIQVIKFPERAVLNYYYLIEQFFDDFAKIAPRQLLRLALLGIYLSRLANNFKLGTYFLKVSCKTRLFYFLPASIALIALWILPKKGAMFLKDNIIKKAIPNLRKLFIN